MDPLSVGIHFKLTLAAAKEKVGVLPLYHLAERLTPFVAVLESMADCRPVEARSRV